jgi:hypothetical protein
LYDAQAAMVHIGRHHQLFKDNAPGSGPDNPLYIKGYVGFDPDEWDDDDSNS